MIRVAVAGVKGRMGELTASAVRFANDLEYVGGFAREAHPAEQTFDDVQRLIEETKPASPHRFHDASQDR